MLRCDKNKIELKSVQNFVVKQCTSLLSAHVCRVFVLIATTE